MLCFASALAAWDPESILERGESTVKSGNSLMVNVTAFDWGELHPGDSASRAVLIQNVGSDPLILSFHVEDWDPVEAAEYLELSWNQEAAVARPGENVAAIFRLEVSWLIRNITQFSFNIRIEGDSL